MPTRLICSQFVFFILTKQIILTNEYLNDFILGLNNKCTLEGIRANKVTIALKQE